MTRQARHAVFIAALLWFAGAAPAAAERLVISLSTHRVSIASNFTGAELTLFGTVEPDSGSVGRPGRGYAVVATVIGPRQSVVTWQKQRKFGIWVNAEQRTFVDAPSYLAVLSNRPAAGVADPDSLSRLQVGLARWPITETGGRTAVMRNAEDSFRAAFMRVKRDQGLYREEATGLTFLTPNLFRAAIPLPANVPVGEYEVDVKLFADGTMLARETTAFEIVKAGFEQYLATTAREYGLLYGLATAMLALLTGWLGSVIFRRD